MKDVRKQLILDAVNNPCFDMFEGEGGRWHFSYTDPELGIRETMQARARYLGSITTREWAKAAEFFIWKAQTKIAREKARMVQA